MFGGKEGKSKNTIKRVEKRRVDVYSYQLLFIGRRGQLSGGRMEFMKADC